MHTDDWEWKDWSREYKEMILEEQDRHEENMQKPQERDKEAMQTDDEWLGVLLEGSVEYEL